MLKPTNIKTATNIQPPRNRLNNRIVGRKSRAPNNDLNKFNQLTFKRTGVL